MTNRKSILFCICIAISLLLPQRSMAQQYGFHKHKRTAAEQALEDSIPLFRGVAVGVDLVGPVMRAVSDYGQYEGFARVNLKDRYFPTVEVGYGSADKTDDVTGLRYKTSAPFGRVGMDFNVMKNKHDAYRILVGFRYAYTSFNYDIGPLVLQDPVWGGSSTYEAKDQKCSYGWLEFGAGVDAQLWKFIRLGWSVRYKTRVHQKVADAGEPWYIPGYGKNGTSRMGILFNLAFEL
ncbi:MAG: DUF6048 family protein [Prevotella sp.]|nr:DUF6048 family protein [Prevotella sp.]